MRIYLTGTALILIVVASPLGCLADDGVLHKEIAAFNKGDYNRAVQLGIEELNHSPRDVTARYYVAQALMKLNRRDEALVQFTECGAQATDQKMFDYCQQAIALLNRQGAGQVPPPKKPHAAAGAESKIHGAPGNEPSGKAGATTSNGEKKPEEEPQDISLLERKADLIQQGMKQVEFLKKESDRKIAAINEEVANQMKDIPPILYTKFGHIPNPEYQDTSDRLQSEARFKIDKITAEFKKREAEITAEYKRRADAYNTVGSNMRSQQKAGNSLIQMTPQNSNSFVRNFVNYDGSMPGSLKARAGSLVPDGKASTKPPHPTSSPKSEDNVPPPNSN